MRSKLLAGLTALVLVAAGCSDDATSREAAAETIAEPGSTDPSAPADAPAPEPVWVEHEAGPECQCADGGEFTYWSRTADPQRVVLFFEGGGACFSAETCDPANATYKRDAGTGFGDDDWSGSGIFDFTNDANPVADWSFVFVPYCTGDVHIGDNVHDYGDDVVVRHNGFVNARQGLDHVVAEFPDVAELLVTGSSAGGVPAPLFAGLASDELPDASIISLSDASGAYPDNPPVNAAIGGIWGTMNNVPDWEVNEGMGPEDFSIPGLYTQSGLHDPDIRFARYDNAYDEVQQVFSRLAQVGGDDQLEVLLANEAGIEAAGVDVSSYVAPGTDHTILGSDRVYTTEVDGVAFIDWLTTFIDGDAPGDVVCTECDRP